MGRRIEENLKLSERFDEAVYLIEHHCPDCVEPDSGKLQQGVLEVEAHLASGARDKAHGYLLLAAAYLDLASGFDHPALAVDGRQVNVQNARRWLDRLKQQFPSEERWYLYDGVALLAGGNDEGRTAIRRATEQTKVATDSDLVEHAAATLARFGYYPQAYELRTRAQKRLELLRQQGNRQ